MDIMLNPNVKQGVVCDMLVIELSCFMFRILIYFSPVFSHFNIESF